MITTIKLQEQMDCNYICKRIHEAIINYQKNNNHPNLTDSILIIDIKHPYDSTDLIPKLENKKLET